MAEYIDRDIVLTLISNKLENQRRGTAFDDGLHCGLERALGIIEDINIADVAPAVHGKNITEMHPVDEFICSKCGIVITDFCRYDPEEDACYEYAFKYCPNCGAKME